MDVTNMIGILSKLLASNFLDGSIWLMLYIVVSYIQDVIIQPWLDIPPNHGRPWKKDRLY